MAVVARVAENARFPRIRTARGKLGRILRHLLANAIKFTPQHGRVDLGAAIQEGRLIIQVADTGIGLTEEERGMIFNEFYQVRCELSDKTPGTGLGLSIVKRLVEAHGGTIHAESEGLGRGSRFVVALPLAPAD